ncbi:hypothetical protein AB0I60_02955 [Actinosynnema sp. NPDC050436]|uniref:hypothetical protein n=1 Tax=Actinosynnema sp. NPDC050436 TaxID=3155659 RepID=UPI0033E1D8CD
MKVFNVRDIPAGVDAALAAVENPRHRHVLKNYRRHALLEVSGLWRDILIPTMTVEHPVYRLTERGRTTVLGGMDEVRGFYSDIVGRGANVFGALEEQVAVSDYGIFIEAGFARVVPGTDPALAGEGADPDGVYQISHRFAAAWPYRDGRLVGEFVYDDTGSWRVDEVARSALVSPAEAREALAPYLAQSPLSEIEGGLRLFRGE